MTTNHLTHQTIADNGADLGAALGEVVDQFAERTIDVEVGNPVDIAEATFNLLAQGPSAPAVDGAAFGNGLPSRPINLVELRSILLHPATGYATRDAVWAELVRRAREDGSVWVIGCIGIALPGLKGIITRSVVSADGHNRHRHHQIVGDMLMAFYEGLRTIDTSKPKIAQRLLGRAYKAVGRSRVADPRVDLTDPYVLAESAEAAVTHGPGGHVDLLLASAVRQGVISRIDAAIIGTTRFEDVDTRTMATELGLTHAALLKRRRRAELKLASAMVDGGLRDEISDLMSDPAL